MDYHGLSWLIMAYHGLSWLIMDYHGLSWIIMAYHITQFLWSRTNTTNVSHGFVLLIAPVFLGLEISSKAREFGAGDIDSW